jgi:hypothetical protein
MNARRQIYILAALSVLTALAAIIVPRFASSGADGLASAATAALTFLALLATALVVALAGLTLTLRAYRTLPWPVRAAGIAPAVVLGVALAWIVAYLRY